MAKAPLNCQPLFKIVNNAITDLLLKENATARSNSNHYIFSFLTSSKRVILFNESYGY
jgi:hypothetical protein